MLFWSSSAIVSLTIWRNSVAKRLSLGARPVAATVQTKIASGS